MSLLESVRPPRKSVRPAPLVQEAAAPPTTHALAYTFDPDRLDKTHDTKPPNWSVAGLAQHAETLAQSVRANVGPLVNAKVTLADADALDAHAGHLRAQEDLWQACLARYATGVVAKLRAKVVAGNRELYGALRTFVDDAHPTHHALDAIPEEGRADDLDAGTSRLIELARSHARDLEGTEVTPARVAVIEGDLQAYRAARAGVREGAESVTTVQTLDAQSRDAWELRNRAFWALVALDRTVCKRGRFRFRGDRVKARLFRAHTATPQRRRKKT
jgi:hypothetical protein